MECKYSIIDFTDVGPDADLPPSSWSWSDLALAAVDGRGCAEAALDAGFDPAREAFRDSGLDKADDALELLSDGFSSFSPVDLAEIVDFAEVGLDFTDSLSSSF